ncbi:FAD-binding oxidoreductase [Tianweitania sp. BSSL-BM11]|uniref:FAD-binding oxidoreductase n=1 Tax=Tianweitania aestuarii TaxID=2814886 RepID=A0ABS5RYR6_9HYPH|nr:FAD-binding oxidoreductase [Tianweitania aestuarii]MBS9722199.1 FAD-binding oxidoreductase [Tianweitania aestuarii]
MLEKLREIVGEKGLIVDRGEMAPFLTDWRNRRTGDALCVVLPASTEEVAAVVKLAAAERQPIFPSGGNTGLCYGAVPETDRPSKLGIVLALQRMNRIREIDRSANLMTVDAGVVLANIHTAAGDIRRQFPLYLGSEGSAQIGGLISTNAGGTGVVKYGPTRDLVAGLEVVLANGTVLRDLAALAKDNTGYLLRHLFIGAEGTLGIITGAVLHLHPEMPNRAHAWVSVASPQAAVDLLAAFQDRAGPYIEAFELVSASQFDLVAKYCERIRIPFENGIPAWSLMIELSSVDSSTDLNGILETLLESGLEHGGILDAVVANSEQQAKDIWHVRHSVSEANKKEGVGVVHDVAVRTSDVPAFIAAADEVAATKYPHAFTEVVCHLGDGNVHYILMFSHEFWASLPNKETYALEVEATIHDVGAQFRGTFSAEHGVGRKLTQELARLCEPVRYGLMQQVKTLFDPDNRMNPGVLVPPADRAPAIDN